MCTISMSGEVFDFHIQSEWKGRARWENVQCLGIYAFYKWLTILGIFLSWWNVCVIIAYINVLFKICILLLYSIQVF